MDKTIPASVLGIISPENLGRVISNKASAICHTNFNQMRGRKKSIAT